MKTALQLHMLANSPCLGLVRIYSYTEGCVVTSKVHSGLCEMFYDVTDRSPYIQSAVVMSIVGCLGRPMGMYIDRILVRSGYCVKD